MLRISCRRFRNLVRQKDDRNLTSDESSFVDSHRLNCEGCFEYEESTIGSLNMLRSSMYEPEPSAGFDDRLIRRIRLQSARTQFSYWSPMVLSATVTAVVVLAAVQLLTQSSNLPVFKADPRFSPEARRSVVEGPLPDFRFTSEMRLK